MIKRKKCKRDSGNSSPQKNRIPSETIKMIPCLVARHGMSTVYCYKLRLRRYRLAVPRIDCESSCERYRQIGR